MKLAIPTRDGVVDSHFGHCAYYTIVEIGDKKEVMSTSTLESPEGCGCKSNIAYQMKDMGITLMLAGNMGQGAVDKLASCGIEVIKGCQGDVMKLVEDYLAGKVVDNPQVCDHHDCGHHGDEPKFRLAL
ncbi:MAG: NifB/NifX family molybdenum-iron cluster-binding protein [Bacteroidales bacterium]|nr:NifB/NifX family molybdenum-iron cluster-binding protein [Bacteroidales bacterium]